MSSLVKIRSERDQMSAIERRIADFILENAQLLRDYSSQQLANALGISQSSVVKFCQKLGFRGYPDLKYSVGEAIARAENGVEPARAAVCSTSQPIAGISKSSVSEAMIRLNAAPITTATARSTTLPRLMNALNPCSIWPPVAVA